MPKPRVHLSVFCRLGLAAFLVGCTSAKKKAESEGVKEEEKSKTEQEVNPVNSLLSMTFAEASAISPKKLEINPFYKIAADDIQIVKTNRDGSPRVVRATGKVFLYIDFAEPAVALCQEAYVGESEVILRGNPLLKRGASVIEGVSKSTVFYMLGLRLRVIGRHRIRNEEQVANDLPDFRYPDTGGGPNPLLPPLSPDSVPSKVRSQMQRAAEAEAVLQRSQIEPVLPLREDVMPDKLAPLLVPEAPPAGKPEGEKKQEKEPEKPADKPAVPAAPPSPSESEKKTPPVPA
jgi:hypothetical protein